MKSIKRMAIVLAVGLSAGIGCGSDSSTNPDAPVINGRGGSARSDAGAAGGAGGASVADAPISTGGSTAGVDGAASIDAPQSGEAGNRPLDTSVGEIAQATGICAGKTPAECDAIIRNAAVDQTVTVQDVPNSNPPAYLTCSQ
jgi:hypothetical protein